MNLHSALQYPFLKYIIEEFSGEFYQNDLTCLNRMLILFHNRYIYSITDNASTYLDEWQQSLEKPEASYWYLKASKRLQIRLVRTRMLFIIKNKRQIVEQLLTRKDYSSPEAKQDFVNQIYHWLCSLPDDVDPATGLDFDIWRQDIENQLGHLLVNTSESFELLAKTPKRPTYHSFYQILAAADESAKKQKFQALVDKLIQANWICSTDNPQVYLFKNTSNG